jgi:RNA polymerase sigma factor (sigma-70 family)
MRTRSPSDIGRLLRDGLAGLTADVLSDAQLLQRFCRQQDGEAFAALVRRHGPLVLGVCRRLLRHEQDAEDAFQATFLVLIKKAGGVDGRDTLAGFLYGIAYRTALKARSLAARRQRKEAEVAARTSAQWQPNEPPDLDAELLDRELSRLPDRYRLPVLLCDLEGKSRKEAACLLGCSEGTLSGRLARARKRLADRLRQTGTAGALGAAGAVLSVAPALLASTVRTAEAFATGGAVPAPILTLTYGVMKTMLLAKLQKAAFGALALAAVCVALWGASALAAPAVALAPVLEPPAKAPEGPAPDASFVPVHLLQDRKVLRELNATAEQRDAIADEIEAAEEVVGNLVTQLLKNLEKLNPDELAKLQKQAEGALTFASQKVITKVLDRKQQARLVQVALQAGGPEVFKAPAVAKELKLTDKQKAKVDEAVKKAGEALEQLFNPVDPTVPLDPDALNPKVLQKINDSAKKDVMDGLTKEQLETWKSMIGKPINFVPRQAGEMFQGLPSRILPLLPLMPGGIAPDGGQGAVPPGAIPPGPNRGGADPAR